MKHLVDKRFTNFLQDEPSDSAVDFIKKLDKHWNTKITDFMPEWHLVYNQNKIEGQFEQDYDLYRSTLEYINKIS